MLKTNRMNSVNYLIKGIAILFLFGLILAFCFPRIIEVQAQLTDTTPPVGSIVINDGATQTTFTNVTLSLTYFDADSGVDKIRLTNAYEWGDEPWEDPVATKEWNLTSGEGSKYVSLQIRDYAGLISDTYWDSIIFGSLPTGSIVINGGAVNTTSTSVTLTLTYTDNIGVAKVRYTNAYEWGDEPWEDPVATKEWNLTSGTGSKYVSYQLRDYAGLISDTYWDSIILANDPPTVSVISGPISGHRDVEYTWNATGSDPNGHDLTYEWYLNGTLTSENSNLTHAFGSEDNLGIYEIKARAKDELGDYSDNATLTFTLLDHSSFNVTYEEDVFVVETLSNSSVTDLTFNQTKKSIGFNVTGITGTGGFCNITIPAELLSGNFTVYMDDTELVVDEDYTMSSNSTHATLSITYEHSSHLIEVVGTTVIPDFAGWLFLPFAMSTTLIMLALRKRLRKPQHV
jgi:hypothetical protein